jgi:23S rRNA pseudoU1915 N3-methylase RlmH
MGLKKSFKQFTTKAVANPVKAIAKAYIAPVVSIGEATGLDKTVKDASKQLPILSELERSKQRSEATVGALEEIGNTQAGLLEAQMAEAEKVRVDKAKEMKTAEMQKEDEAKRVEGEQFRDSARARQKKLAAGARGRRSTILTEGLASSGSAPKKTLLGQ